MSSILFLVTTAGTPHNDNGRRLPAAFERLGWHVTTADHETLAMRGGTITVGHNRQPIDDFDLVWMVGLGERASFLDRMQLLSTVSPLKFVVRPQALLQLHAKYALPAGPLAKHHPETHASHDAAWLREIVQSGGTWIAKPAAGSFGREVYRVDARDPNLTVILESLTGHDGSRYCVLQRYVCEIEHGEKRVLVAGGRPIASYLRLPQADHRANIAADAQARATTLTNQELSLARECAQWLAREGAGFAAVDMAYPWIVEFNVANPGGLATIERLTGHDHSAEVARAVSDSNQVVASQR